MAGELDFRQLAAFKEQLLQVAKVYPKEVENSLSNAGNTAKKMLKEQSPSTDSDHKNKLKNSWHGKISADSITAKDTAYNIWTTAPHFHLVNNGHVQTTHTGKPIRYIAGQHFFEKTMEEVEEEVIPQKLEKLYRKIKRKIER